MINTGIITCGLALIAPLKLFVLQPWSYTSMLCRDNIAFVSVLWKGCAQFFLCHGCDPLRLSQRHRLARRLRLSSTWAIHDLSEDFYYQGDFRLYPNHLVNMESDNTVLECISDSSNLDSVIGDDSLLLSAIKNDAKERFIEATRAWKSIVICIFGTDDDFSQSKNH